MTEKKKSKFDKFCEKVESEFAALREATSIKIDENSEKKKTPKLLTEQLETYRSQLEETHKKVASLEEIVTPLLRNKSDVFKKVIDFLFN